MVGGDKMKLIHRIIPHNSTDGRYRGYTLVYVTRDLHISIVTFGDKDQPVAIKTMDEQQARELLWVLKEIFSEG